MIGHAQDLDEARELIDKSLRELTACGVQPEVLGSQVVEAAGVPVRLETMTTITTDDGPALMLLAVGLVRVH